MIYLKGIYYTEYVVGSVLDRGTGYDWKVGLLARSVRQQPMLHRVSSRGYHGNVLYSTVGFFFSDTEISTMDDDSSIVLFMVDL